jgi:hypothetical protein
VTATAGEDEGGFRAFGDQPALNDAALRVSGQLELQPRLKQDIHGRPYVEICNCEFLSDAYRAAVVFFANLDAGEVGAKSIEG